LTTTTEEAELPLLTSSRLRCFRECPRKHAYAYVEGFRPAKTSEALRFGTLLHAGLEGYWLAIRDGADPLDWALSSIEGRGFDIFEQIRAEELLRGYATRWAEDARDFEVVAVEAEFRAPLMNPASGLTASRTWRLAGKIDLIVRRRADGRVLVGEHKSTVERIEDDADHYWSTLAIDGQISGYVVGAEALGHQVDEILYDVVRKPGQRPAYATPPEQRKYTKPTKTEPSRLYAGQRETDEAPGEYRERIRAAISSDLASHFQRRSISRTQSQIAEYLTNTWAWGRIIREAELAGRMPGTSEACHRFGQCAYWLACSTGTHPADHPSDYVKLDNVHPELAQ